jgi:hypothetical protein
MRHFGLAAITWAARILSLFVVGAFLFLLAGEFLDPHSGPPTTFREWAGIVLFVGSVMSLLVAWKWELPGAVVSLVALITFVFVVRMRRFDIVVIAAIPGLLFLVDWFLRRGARHQVAH